MQMYQMYGSFGKIFLQENITSFFLECNDPSIYLFSGVIQLFHL